jgi:hypothetical protein
MGGIKPEDDFCHADYPRNIKDIWKENWYFNFVDIEQKAWGYHHFSLRRDTQRGIFRAIHMVDGLPLIYENEMGIDGSCEKISDGALSFEIMAPHKQHHVIFNGPRHKVDLLYNARFGLVDSGSDRQRGESDNKRLHIEHYEQAMFVTGSILKDGKTRPINCLGHRDHSWGFRNEELIQGWNWIAIQFPDRTFSFAKARITENFAVDRGHISHANGIVNIFKIKVATTVRDAEGAPTGSVYQLEDAEGRTWTITSKRFAHISLPMKEKKGGVVHENFSTFLIEESNETGIGVDEYMEDAR